MSNSHSSILIQDAEILDPVLNTQQPGDLLIEDGKIAAIDLPGRIPVSRASSIVQAAGLWLTPGLIDIHVHLREPGLEYKETIATGTQAAVAGGFTSVACMANTQPVNDNAYVTAFIRERAKAHAACRVFPIGAVSKGLKGEELAEIGGMVAEGAVALSDDGMPVMNSYLMRKAMDYAKAFGIPVISHAEDANLVGQGVMNESALSNRLGLRGNPTAAEEIMVAREIALCRLTRTPVHIAHLTTKLGLKLVQRAKEEGLPITAEVSPHHLCLTEDAVQTYNTACKMAPPLRTSEDVQALKQGLKQGIIDIIATDHAPHGEIDKAVEFDHAAFGIIGLQTVVPICLRLVEEGTLTPLQWIKTMTLHPARLLNIPHGTLTLGSDADITLIRPHSEWTFTEDKIRSKSKNSPFIGAKFKGGIFATFVGGRPVHRASDYVMT